MAVTSISMPDAIDINSADIVPARELESANHLLDDHDALMKFYNEQGYLLLRNVLDPQSVATARAAMFAVMERHGLIEPGATIPYWTGVPFPGGMEESPEFAGISSKLMSHPVNAAIMAKVLGEEVCTVPIVQYRTYPPGGSVTGVHQDGFFSPGIQDYKPVWTPLCECEREVGGLMVAVGQTGRGYLHNLAKAPQSPIPACMVPEDSWATTDYHPGDVLIIHPEAPHASMANTSNRCRVTIDTRVQSAAAPRILLGNITAFSADSITIRTDSGEIRTFTVDGDTFIRLVSPGVRMSMDEYLATTELGKRIVVIFNGNHAETLRRASEG